MPNAPFQFGNFLFAAFALGAVTLGVLAANSDHKFASASPAHDIPENSVWTETIEYYSFSADDLRSAHASMFEASPIVIDGRKFSGLMEWEWEWRAAYDTADGNCAPGRIVTRASSNITLPKWTSYEDASYQDRVEWDRASQVLLRHEKKHETIAKMAVKEFERKANRLPAAAECETLTAQINDLFDRYMKQANTQNKSYDRRTDHGRTEGAKLRLPNFSAGY